MASLVLHNAMVDSIVRGFKILRGIELTEWLAEEQLLEARMVVAASLDDQWDDEWAPSPEEIAAACSVIQSAWSDEERDLRWRSDHQNFIVRQYYARHRAEILQHNKDLRKNNPERAARMYEASRRWKARNQAALKEYRHGRRATINEQKRARRAQMTDEQRESAKAYNRKYRELHNAEAAEKRRNNREHENQLQRAWRAKKRAAATC